MAMYQGKSTRGRGQHCIGLPSTPSSSLTTPHESADARAHSPISSRKNIYTREKEKGGEKETEEETAASVGVAQQSGDCERLRANFENPHWYRLYVSPDNHHSWTCFFIDGKVDPSHNFKSNLKFDLLLAYV